MFRNIFLRGLFLLLHLLSVPMLFGQAPIEIVSPVPFLSPATQDDNDLANPYVFCNDTVLLKAPVVASGNKKNWILFPESKNYVVLQGDSLSSQILIKLSTSIVTEVKWKRTNTDVRSIFIQTLKPTLPNAGKDTTICQNSLKLNANNPAIGKGQWICNDTAVKFQNNLLYNTIVSNLAPGKTTLIWQISSVCDTLQDTILVNNQSILPSEVQAGNKYPTCTDTASLFATILPIGYTGKWYSDSNVVVGETEVVHGVKLRKFGGINIFKWEVTNPANCTGFDYDTIIYSIPTQANIVFPTKDTTVCNNQIELRGKNKGGTWLIKGSTIPIDTGITSIRNTLLSGDNVFYRIFTDPICGQSLDSILVINKSVYPPFIGSDTTVCGDSVVLKTDSQLPGFWTNIKSNQQIGTNKIVKVGSLIADTISYSWTSIRQGSICTASDTRTIIYRKIQAANISSPQKDTTVCADTISLKALGNGTWSRPNLSFSSTQNLVINHRLTSDTNVFYWTVEDAICGNTIDSIRVFNKTVPKPDAGSDKISCSTTSTLIANDTISGKWYKLIGVGDSLIGNTVRIDISGLLPGYNKYYRKSDNSFCSLNDTVNVFYQKTLEAKIQVPTNSDTAVCQNQVSLAGNGVGKWTKKDTTFSSSNSSITFTGLKSDTNVFYWTVTDSVCGKAVDSVRVVNRAIAKPSVVLDSCFIGIPTDSLLLSPKSIVSSGNTGVWSSETTSLKSNLLNNSAKFKPNSVGQYKFKFKVSNTTCSDSATTTYRILTKAQLAKDSCILKKRGELAIVNIKNNFPANISRGEKGVWAHLDTNAINEFDPNKPDLGFKALRGVYSFVYTISDTCKTCTSCESKDTITVSVTNKANIIENNICLLADTQQVKVNPLLVNKKEMEKGGWKSSNLNLTFQNPKNDTVFTVSSLPIGKHELIWTVTHLSGCGTTSDTVRIARITTPDAGPDRCYDAGNKNLKDDIFANNLAPGELGQWNYFNNSQIKFDRYELDTNYCTVRHNDPGIYYLKWSMASNLCPLETFSDVVKLSFVTQPKLSADTFFTIPFSREHILTGSPLPSLVNKEKSKWTFPTGFSDSTKLKINEYPAGKYIFKYSISDSSKTMPCTLSDSIEVVYLTKAFIKKSRIDTCVKGVNIEFVANSASPSEIVTWSSFTTTIQPKLGNPSIANISLLPIGKHKVYLTITSLGGRFASKDSIIVTKLNTPTVSNDKICRDTLVVLNSPFDVKNLKGHEKAYWVSNNGLLNGVGLQDTIRQLKPGNHLAGLVIKDTASFCADTAKVKITKVSKAIAFNTQTLCITDTFTTINAITEPVTGENGRWSFIRNTFLKTPSFDSTSSRTAINGLGRRSTRLMWKITNNIDKTCFSADTVNTRIVVLTKPKALPEDPCIEFFGQAINLTGNRSSSASYEISRWSMLDGKLLANSQNLTYTPDSAGYKKLLYTIIDFTNNYRCEISDTTILRLVPRASIITPNLCVVLTKGQTNTDTLKVNVFSKVAGLTYRLNGNLIAGVPSAAQTKTYNLPNKYVNEWEILLGANCPSKDSDTTTVISEAIAGTGTCLIGADTISLNGSLPQSASNEFGRWSVLEGSAKFSDSTNYNSKVTFNKKGLTTLKWKIQNGTCTDSDSIMVSSISKANFISNPPSCIKEQNAPIISLKGQPITGNEKAYWQNITTGNSVRIDSSSANMQSIYGVNRFKYTIYDPLYPTCSDSIKVSVSVLKKPEIDPTPACNNYHPSINNISVPLEAKPNISGLTYVWRKDKTLVRDTIIEENNSSKLQYNSVGKRTLWFKSFVTDNPSCSDSVLKTIQVITKVVFTLDTCVTDSVFKLIPAMYPDFNSGEYILAILDRKQFRIKKESDIISGYPKGKNRVNWEVKSADSSCTVNLGETFSINYISKSTPSEATICKYFEEGLQVALSIPQRIDTTTEKGAWLSGDDTVKVENNTATNIRKGKNLLKWRISSNSNSKCYSDSTVNYYTLTPSGFNIDTLFTCSRDTSIASLPPTSSERVDWSVNLQSTLRDTTNSSIRLQNLSNDIDKTITVIRKISLGEVCPLSDTIRVLNRQLDGLNFANAFNDEIQSDPINTCLNQTFIYLFDPKKDIPTANLELFASNSPSGNLVKLTQVPDPNPKKIKFLTPQLLKGQYTFTAEAKNANCPVLKAQLNLTKSVDIAVSELPYLASVCDNGVYELKNLNIKTPNITIDSVRWITPEGASYSVSDNKSSGLDTLKVLGLPYGGNSLQYVIFRENCKATYSIKISNHQLSQTPKILQGDSVFKCNSDSIKLTGQFNNSEITETSLFKYYWTKDNLDNLVKRDTNLVVNKTNQPLNQIVKYYFVVKNGVCDARFDSVLVANYQKIDSISAGTNDTLCATKLQLNGANSNGIGQWFDISKPENVLERNKTNPTVKLVSNRENQFLWKVTNGVCKDSATLKILVGDSISTAKVKQKEIIDCDTGDVLLKGNNPVLNSGKGFWWKKPNETLVNDSIVLYDLVSQLEKESFVFYYTIKNNYCSTTDSTIVRYFKTPSTANAGPDQTLVKKQTLMNANHPEVGIGTWRLKQGEGAIEGINNPNTNITYLVFGDNVFIWSISNGETCKPSEDEVILAFSDFDIPQAFSPNGDGKNDRFEIVGLENYSGSKLKVLNRWGREVYTSDDYQNNWDGASLEEDTYFFLLEIPGIELKKGYVVIKRK